MYFSSSCPVVCTDFNISLYIHIRCIHCCCIYCIQIDNELVYSIIVNIEGVANKLPADMSDAGVPHGNFSGDTSKASTEEILEGVILEMEDL